MDILWVKIFSYQKELKFLSIPTKHYIEGLPGALGNKGTKAYFWEQGTPKSKKYSLSGNTGTQGKFCWEQGNMDRHLERPSIFEYHNPYIFFYVFLFLITKKCE